MNLLELFENKTLIASGNHVKITRQLERDEFVKLKTIFDDYRGVWSRKENAFEFVLPFEPFVKRLKQGKSLPSKKEMNFFPTPRKAWQPMINELVLIDDMNILEPSCGIGANFDLLQEIALKQNVKVNIDCVELDEINRTILEHKNIPIVHDDFLTYDTEKRYDLIVMNPPFNVSGDSIAWFTHVRKAFDLLKPHGTIYAIIPHSIGTCISIKNKKEAVNWVAVNSDWVWDLERGVFAESGTMIPTQLIKIGRDTFDKLMQPTSGYSSWFSFNANLTIDSTAELVYSINGKTDYLNALSKIEKTGGYVPLSEIDNAWNDFVESKEM